MWPDALLTRHSLNRTPSWLNTDTFLQMFSVPYTSPQIWITKTIFYIFIKQMLTLSKPLLGWMWVSAKESIYCNTLLCCFFSCSQWKLLQQIEKQLIAFHTWALMNLMKSFFLNRLTKLFTTTASVRPSSPQSCSSPCPLSPARHLEQASS